MAMLEAIRALLSGDYTGYWSATWGIHEDSLLIDIVLTALS